VNRKTIADAFRRRYLQLDARALGLGRIVFASVLLLDLLRRVPWISELYTNAGVLPNHTVLWRPPVARLFSFMFMSSLPEEAVLWFAVSFFCFFCFLIGWHTRVFAVLSFVMTTSLHNRVLFAENWGGATLNYRGSLISFFTSRQGIGTYKCCSIVYGAPTRGYNFEITVLCKTNFVFGPVSSGGYGAASAVIGLLAANAIFKQKMREDVRNDIGLFVLLILFSILIGFRCFGWLMLIGGVVVGALVGVVFAYAPRRNRSTVQVVGLLGVIMVCLLAVALKLTIF
jgi:hypothetical protein